MLDKGAVLAGERESLILDAAQRRFAAFGLTKVTMDEIAADIGMGKASLYYYFPTKEELFKAVVVREQRVFLARMAELLASDRSAADKLRHYAERRLEFFAELVNLQLLNLQSWLYSRPVFQDLFVALDREELALVTTILKSGQDRGEFAPFPLEETAAVVLHTLQGLRLRVLRAAQLHHELAVPPAALAAETRRLLQLLLNGLCCTPAHGKG